MDLLKLNNGFYAIVENNGNDKNGNSIFKISIFKNRITYNENITYSLANRLKLRMNKKDKITLKGYYNIKDIEKTIEGYILDYEKTCKN